MTDLGFLAPAVSFLLFCRIGACLMILPGLSSARVPMRVRLYLAIAISLALTPLLAQDVVNAIPDPNSSSYFLAIGAEFVVGAANGMMSRMFFLAFDALLSAAAMSVGLSANIGVPIEGDEAVPALASLLTLSSVAILFASDIHLEIITGLIATYQAIPIGSYNARFGLVALTDVASASFFACLRITSPFIVLGLLVNFAFALLNKLVQQVPIYFVSLPFSVAAGLFLMYFLSGEAIALFTRSLLPWITLR